MAITCSHKAGDVYTPAPAEDTQWRRSRRLVSFAFVLGSDDDPSVDYLHHIQPPDHELRSIEWSKGLIQRRPSGLLFSFLLSSVVVFLIYEQHTY